LNKANSHEAAAAGVRRRRVVGGALAIASGIGASSGARSQSYPARPVRIVVPYAPGGAVDQTARPLARALSDLWGQAVIVENIAGASGTTGCRKVAKAASDGYELLVCSVGEIAILPSTFANLPYDPVRDFEPVTQLLTSKLLLAANASVPFASLPEMVDYAVRNPGKLTYGSVGVGSISHLAGEMLRSRAAIDMLHIPFKGAASATADLLGHQVDMAFLGTSVMAPFIASGRARGLAIAVSGQSSVLPDVPPISRFYPGFEVNSWHGLFAPAGTPKGIILKLQRDVADIMTRQQYVDSMRARDTDVEVTSPEDFSRIIKRDMANFASAAKTAGLVRQ
jgi:tripartite-type tricarboxylate transporter receptor subunit TctC